VQLDEARRLIALFQMNEAERIRELDDIVDASHKTSQVISLVDANWRQQVVDLKAALATSNRRESSLEAEALQLRRDCAAKDDTIHRLGVQLTALEADVRALRAAKSDALAAMQDAQRRWEVCRRCILLHLASLSLSPLTVSRANLILVRVRCCRRPQGSSTASGCRWRRTGRRWCARSPSPTRDSVPRRAR
jgi:hypothetical protein